MGQRARLKWAGPTKSAANDREPAGGVCAGFRGGHRCSIRATQHSNPGSLSERDLFGKPASVPDHALDIRLEHDLFRKPVSTPDQVRGRLFRDHALALRPIACFVSSQTSRRSRKPPASPHFDVWSIDPEKWKPVFGQDHAQINNLDRDPIQLNWITV